MIQGYTAVIQAGGRGTRMEKLTKNRFPKPMLPLNGRPILEWQIENLKKYGISEFVLIIGYLGDCIKAHFADGASLGVRIRYIEEKEPLGSGGALYFLGPILETEGFILVYGDVVFDVDMNRAVRFHKGHGGLATLLVHPNAHPYDSDLLHMDPQNRVTGIDSKHNTRNYWYENCVNAGFYIMSADILKRIPQARRLDLEQDILLPLAAEGKAYGYRTPEYIRDVGTPERFSMAAEEQQKGVWQKKNLENKQICVFLDRDGTVNKYCGLLYSEEALELEDGAAEAVRRLNEAGILAVVVTNQPVVARGLCEIEDVERIHRKMQVLLGEQGAYLDDITFCPHHPDKGYPGENRAYKTVCGCRKPAIGMIQEITEKFNIDLGQSFMVGDSTTDIQTGKNAGLKTILVATGQAGCDGKYNAEPDKAVKNLGEAVEYILTDSRQPGRGKQDDRLQRENKAVY